VYTRTTGASVLIVLGERLTKTRIHRAKHNGVGHGLDQEGLTRRQGEEEARSQDHEENHRDDDVGVDHLIPAREKTSPEPLRGIQVAHEHIEKQEDDEPNQGNRAGDQKDDCHDDGVGVDIKHVCVRGV